MPRNFAVLFHYEEENREILVQDEAEVAEKSRKETADRLEFLQNHFKEADTKNKKQIANLKVNSERFSSQPQSWTRPLEFCRWFPISKIKIKI